MSEQEIELRNKIGIYIAGTINGIGGRRHSYTSLGMAEDILKMIDEAGPLHTLEAPPTWWVEKRNGELVNTDQVRCVVHNEGDGRYWKVCFGYHSDQHVLISDEEYDLIRKVVIPARLPESEIPDPPDPPAFTFQHGKRISDMDGQEFHNHVSVIAREEIMERERDLATPVPCSAQAEWRLIHPHVDGGEFAKYACSDHISAMIRKLPGVSNVIQGVARGSSGLCSWGRAGQ